MSALATDKFRKGSRRWVGQVGSGGVADGTTSTIPLSSVTNLATDTAVTLVIDRVDANGTATPQYEETIIGVVSGSSIINAIRGAEGTAQAHNSGSVVEELDTAKGYNDIIDGILVQHNQDGTHNASFVATPSGTTTFTNKRITPRVGSTTSSATPTINTDNVDIYELTAQTVDITSFTTNLSGTPTDGQILLIQITGTAARAITWGSSFEASTTALPTTTVTTARLDTLFIWNTATSKWRCLAVA